MYCSRVEKSADKRARPQPPLSARDGTRDSTPSVYGLDDLDRYQGFLAALSEAAVLQRVPVSATSKEYAPGQFEANLRHQANAVTASDHAVFLRQIVRGAAAKQHARASFMAKPYPDRSGSGQHVHLSLIDRAGCNVFDNGT